MLWHLTLFQVMVCHDTSNFTIPGSRQTQKQLFVLVKNLFLNNSGSNNILFEIIIFEVEINGK